MKPSGPGGYESEPGEASTPERAGEAFARLVTLMTRLRAPDGCPWDREQSLHTLRPYLLEEAYEVLESIEENDPAAHREELGDLLFQVVFQAQIRDEEGHFDAGAVADGIREKLERRHPHVFGDATVTDRDEVARNWHAIKAREKKRESALDGIPAAMPALLRAGRITAKAATSASTGPTSTACWPSWPKNKPSWRKHGPAAIPTPLLMSWVTCCLRLSTWPAT
jgi:uncharacterized protein YabN with tetrapyrrole methylase and pyrophosphatase domain